MLSSYDINTWKSLKTIEKKRPLYIAVYSPNIQWLYHIVYIYILIFIKP